ncbi:MAG: hypothetical protein ACRDK0_00125 [Solirubrobacteraceae bacterium]
MPAEGVVNALRRIHDALVAGGLVIDTQPVSVHPPITTGVGDLGTLDMREWAQTIETVDRLIEQTIRDGLFGLEEESRFVVTDEYDDGAEFVAETRQWAGTHIDEAFAEHVATVQRPVRLHQEIRLRVLRAR